MAESLSSGMLGFLDLYSNSDCVTKFSDLPMSRLLVRNMVNYKASPFCALFQREPLAEKELLLIRTCSNRLPPMIQ